MTQSDKIVVHFGVGNIHKNYSFVAFVPNLIFAFSILHLASSSQRKQLTAPIIHIQFSVTKKKTTLVTLGSKIYFNSVYIVHLLSKDDKRSFCLRKQCTYQRHLSLKKLIAELSKSFEDGWRYAMEIFAWSYHVISRTLFWTFKG